MHWFPLGSQYTGSAWTSYPPFSIVWTPLFSGCLTRTPTGLSGQIFLASTHIAHGSHPRSSPRRCTFTETTSSHSLRMDSSSSRATCVFTCPMPCGLRLARYGFLPTASEWKQVELSASLDPGSLYGHPERRGTADYATQRLRWRSITSAAAQYTMRSAGGFTVYFVRDSVHSPGSLTSRTSVAWASSCLSSADTGTPS